MVTVRFKRTVVENNKVSYGGLLSRYGHRPDLASPFSRGDTSGAPGSFRGLFFREQMRSTKVHE